MLVIADLGTGNLRSVRRALEHVTSDRVRVSSEAAEIAACERLVLPGQGAMGAWITQLERDPPLRSAVMTRLRAGPVLGICLGLQALYEFSEENGGTPGLGVMPGRVRRFRGGATAHGGEKPLKIPHMGWNNVVQTGQHPLWRGIEDGARFYFVHSYYVQSAESGQVLGECDYGGRFTAAAGCANLFATQFHPEKSQQAGLKLLENFVNWNGGL